MKTDYSDLEQFIARAQRLEEEILSLKMFAFELEEKYTELDNPEWNGNMYEDIPLSTFCNDAQDSMVEAVVRVKDFIADNSNDTTGAR